MCIRKGGTVPVLVWSTEPLRVKKERRHNALVNKVEIHHLFDGRCGSERMQNTKVLYQVYQYQVPVAWYCTVLRTYTYLPIPYENA